MVGLRGVLGVPLVHARTHGMGRTLGQQWYGGTEVSLLDSLQSPPGIMGGKDCGTAVVWWD